MKLLYFTITLVLAALGIPGHAKEAVAEPTGSNRQGTSGSCGNDANGIPKCKKCPDESSNQPNAEQGSSCDTNSINAYSGNAHRAISDLVIAGSVGKMPLEFKRFSNTRLSGRNLSHSAFGIESAWSHNYEWVMRDYGGTATQPIVKITYPDGQVSISGVGSRSLTNTSVRRSHPAWIPWCWARQSTASLGLP